MTRNHLYFYFLLGYIFLAHEKRLSLRNIRGITRCLIFSNDVKFITHVNLVMGGSKTCCEVV